MARKKIEEKEFDINDAREALDKVEAKLSELTTAVERRLAEDRRGVQRAPLTKTNVKPVEMPGDIEVDTHDKYNTQPKNSSLHHYRQNHKMFRKDAMRNVMRSKMFWILLVTLPVIFTFIEYVFTGWGIVNDFIMANGLSKVTVDLVNWFMIMPMLLLSLTVFPTFIAMSRENNQLKRYAMKGMSRKQIYWSYIRFSTMFLFVFMFIWMGPWVMILNAATDSIWLSEEQIAAGQHVFNNPWDIFFGMNFKALRSKDSINAANIAFMWNQQLINDAFAANPDANIIGIITSLDYITQDDVLLFLINNNNDLNAIQEQFAKIGIEFEFRNEEQALLSLQNLTLESLDANSGMISLPQRITILLPAEYSGIKTVEFFTLLVLVTIGINSVGFNKAMKVGSSRALMGWGIGLWIFSSVVQGSASLLYNDVYKFDSIDQQVWNTVVMILLFILKWMFLFSPVTIMIVGISLTTGLVAEPEVVTLPTWAASFMEAYANNPAWSDVIWISNIYNSLLAIDIYNPLIKPENITKIFMGLSALWALLWIFKTWLFKSRIVSYESSR